MFFCFNFLDIVVQLSTPHSKLKFAKSFDSNAIFSKSPFLIVALNEPLFSKGE